MSLDDLVIIAADGMMRAVLEALLNRHQALGIRPLHRVEVRVMAGRDPGVRKEGPEVAGSFRSTHSHALVICDHEGSGFHGTPEALQQDLTERVRRAFGPASSAVVLVPELEE